MSRRRASRRLKDCGHVLASCRTFDQKKKEKKKGERAVGAVLSCAGDPMRAVTTTSRSTYVERRRSEALNQKKKKKKERVGRRSGHVCLHRRSALKKKDNLVAEAVV